MVYYRLGIFVILGFFLASYAEIAQAEDPFTVAAVPVDATGVSAIEAQTLAISDGQLRAAQVLFERLTLANARRANPLPPLDIQSVAPLIRALEIANEKRSGRRYLGDITVTFNPSAVQNYLARYDHQMISTQSRKRLVLPVLYGQELWAANAWQNVWKSKRYLHALTPVTTIEQGQGGNHIITADQAWNLDKAALMRVGQRYGVNQILVAVGGQSGGQLSARVTDIALDTGVQRDLGVFSGQSFSDLSDKVMQSLENDWKRTTLTSAANAEEMVVTVLYRSHDDWQDLQDAINNSAQIQQARLDALSKDGALMTLTYGGDISRLRTELTFKGVDIRSHPELGIILMKSGQF